MFLQETHSTVYYKTRRQDELKGKLFFSHWRSNSCRVAIGFLGNMNFNVLNKIPDKDERILILDIPVEDAAFSLINLYNLTKNVSNLMS